MKKLLLALFVIFAAFAIITCNKKEQPPVPNNNPVLISITIDSQTSEIKRIK